MSELVTLEEFAGYTKRDLDELDAYTAQQMLDAAEELVREYCGWHIAPSRTETLTADGSGSRIQPLPTMHLTAVVEASEAGTALDVNALDWSTYGVLEKQDGGAWTSRRRGVVAEVTHGFAATPSWLLALLCSAAGRALLTPLGIAAESAGGESVTYATPYLTPPGAVMFLEAEYRMLDRLALPSSP